MNIFKFFQCLRVKHIWYNSRRKRGYMTCKRCGMRRKY